MLNSTMDKQSYDEYLAQEASDTIESGTSDYVRYVISAYPYFRSRLLVPGRCYEDDSHGMMAIGGSAHMDVIDLDMWLSEQSPETMDEALDWILGSSLEQIAYWRGFGRGHKGTLSRRREKLAEKAKEKVGTNATNSE